MGTIPLVTSLLDPRNLATVAVFASVTVLGLYGIWGKQRSRKVVVFALSLVVFPYVPASNLFFPVGFVVAERVLYVPSMGICLLVAHGLWTLHQHLAGGRKGTGNGTETMSLVQNGNGNGSKNGNGTLIVCLGIGFSLLLGVHSLRTLVRNREWASDMDLFTSAVKVNPNNGKIYNNLGFQYEYQDDFVRAEELFRKAVELQPDDIGAYINVGRVLKTQEKHKESEIVSE